jgi:histone H3
MGSIHLLSKSDAAGQLDVLGLDGDTFGMEGAQVGVFEEGDAVGLGGFLEGQDGGTLKAEVLQVVLGELPDEALEGEFADQEIGGFLVPADFAEGDGPGSESAGFLDITGSGVNAVSIRLFRELFAGRLTRLIPRGYASNG